MYKLVFFVPEEYKEEIKKALFLEGAGKYKNYDMCSYEAKGTGQFRPIEGSNPFIGEKNILEKVTEYRVEVLCDDEIIKKTVLTLLEKHPYEETAYEVYKILDIDEI